MAFWWPSRRCRDEDEAHPFVAGFPSDMEVAVRLSADWDYGFMPQASLACCGGCASIASLSRALDEW